MWRVIYVLWIPSISFRSKTKTTLDASPVNWSGIPLTDGSANASFKSLICSERHLSVFFAERVNSLVVNSYYRVVIFQSFVVLPTSVSSTPSPSGASVRSQSDLRPAVLLHGHHHRPQPHLWRHYRHLRGPEE